MSLFINPCLLLSCAKRISFDQVKCFCFRHVQRCCDKVWEAKGGIKTK